MRSIFRFFLVLAIAIIIGIGINYAEQAAYNASLAMGLNSNSDNGNEVRPTELRPDQPRPPKSEDTNPGSVLYSLARKLWGGVKGMGIHVVFVAVVMFMVVVFRKYLNQINSSNLKRTTNPTSKS